MIILQIKIDVLDTARGNTEPLVFLCSAVLGPVILSPYKSVKNSLSPPKRAMIGTGKLDC